MTVTTPLNNFSVFAENGLRNFIPVTTTQQGSASMEKGFPEKNMQPRSLGGIPPSGKDMNGILNQLSSHQVFLNAGGMYRFDPAYAASEGYAAGSVLQLDDGLSAVISLVNGNSNNPNESMTGWGAYAGKLVNDAIADCTDNKYDKSGGTITGNTHVTGALSAHIMTVGGDTTIYPDNSDGVERAVLVTSRDQFYMNKPVYFGDYSTDTDGYTELPNGFVMQFGFIPYSSASGNLTGSTTGEKVFNLTFPVPFAVGCFSLHTTLCIAALDIGNDTWSQVYGVSSTGATVMNQTTNAESSSQQPFMGIYWQAIGR